MYDLDVPDLIGALADRFEEYDISPREAAIITVEMLANAMDAIDQLADEQFADLMSPGTTLPNMKLN